MAERITNLLLVGVGGQGSVLASKVIARAVITAGFDVKVSEVHGMAQRGGSVVSQVRFGDKVYSPLVAKGEADVILAFEKLEAARWLPYLKQDGQLIVNDQEIYPLPVITGQADYPAGIIDMLRQKAQKVISLNALELAVSHGNPRGSNVVLLGVLAKLLNMNLDTWLTALAETVPPKTIESNKAVFMAGYNFTG